MDFEGLFGMSCGLAATVIDRFKGGVAMGCSLE